jgi:hypothetical protein
MLEQLTGAASALVLILAYLLIVQTLMAASVLLGQFIVVQIRTLRSLVAIERPEPTQEPQAPYGIGGGLIRWH